MAIHQLEHQQQNPSLLLDSLYCQEEKWEEEEEEIEKDSTNPSLLPLFLLEQDLFWEDEELLSLFSKEHHTHLHFSDPSLFLARGEAVDWILKVKARHGFTPLTAVLAINYLDRFLFSLHFQRDKPWMIQLVAVTCLSLAAKVEETQVPLLLDLQVEDTKYVFEAKTIQRMELLVLSTLQWRMNPVTPLSFIDHITRRLGLKTQTHWEFLRRCEDLILSVVSDSRFVRYPPSVLATATMLHVIQEVEPCNPIQYQNQLLDVLKISKEKVGECCRLIVDLSNTCFYDQNNPHKRKYEQIPDSPSGVIDACLSCDSSNDSWVVGSPVSSSPQPLLKKSRAKEKQMLLIF
ncbi:cyclin-D3-1-like [Cornus florida]|uniref:cyclin-D3-1-like n=1 Tax=Cornus florida TaxID=4283 RepID=UPI00289674DA|nr:cyclin-D3-1-like [Cornus florida]